MFQFGLKKEIPIRPNNHKCILLCLVLDSLGFWMQQALQYSDSRCGELVDERKGGLLMR